MRLKKGLEFETDLALEKLANEGEGEGLVTQLWLFFEHFIIYKKMYHFINLRQ